jgi:hypothetical protein
MKIEVIAEHKIDLSLLPKMANILDLGCRGFLFADELKRLGHCVTCVDCDESIMNGKHWYYNLAITDFNGWVRVIKSNDPQATKVSNRNDGSLKEMVPSMTLEAFSKMVHVPQWDYIKTDIEGSELEVIRSLHEAPSTQFEVEFHRHTGAYGDGQIEEMVNKLVSLGYAIASHDKTSQHGLAPNYWSSLFILK